MAGWDAKERLRELDGTLIDAAMSLTQFLQSGARGADLETELYLITSELWGWGIESKEEFARHLEPPLICWEVLQLRDGPEKWQNRPQGLGVEDVRLAAFEEYRNLMRILSKTKDIDLERAIKFCQLLNSVSLHDQWERICYKQRLGAL